MNPGKKPLIAQCVRRANEFKFPIDDLTDLYVIDQFLEEHEIGDRLVWLQPISQGEEATKVCLSQARIRGWRISIQTHKYLGLR
jgi:7-carboxy-7-deazaguanine synthase